MAKTGGLKRLVWLCASVLPLFAGCVSVVEGAGRMLDGSAFAERRQAVYRTAETGGRGVEVRVLRDGDGGLSLAVLPERFPSAVIRGTYPDGDGNFLLVSLDYMGGNVHGWNEFSLDLFGYGSFLRDGDGGATLSIPPDFEPVQISRGRIRRYDTRIAGDEALTYLRNRRERVLALTEWMHAHADGGTPSPPGRPTLREFGRHWKPLLFPELVAGRNRPQGWRRPGDRFVRAENIAWNTGYTERVFPEELRGIRDSGTMLRDWEEALEWIHLKHGLGDLRELLSGATVLGRVR